MRIGTLKQAAVIAGLAGALSLAAVTSSSAAWRGHWGPGAAIGAGTAGFALGAGAAANAPYYGYGPYYGGYYDYAPGPVVVDPGPTYYDYDGGPYRRPGTCHYSISGC